MIANTTRSLIRSMPHWQRLRSFWPAYKKSNQRFSLEGLTMGTSYQIQLLEVPGEEEPGVLADEVQTILSRLDREIFLPMRQTLNCLV